MWQSALSKKAYAQAFSLIWLRRKGDIYVHAELHGASTTVIKNQQPDQPIPPLTIAQARCSHSRWQMQVGGSAELYNAVQATIGDNRKVGCG